MTALLSATEVSSVDVEQMNRLASELSNAHLAAVLTHLTSAIRRGADVALLATDRELSPNEVAKLLNVSRPYVVKLMDRGLLAYRLVGKHRRVAVPDLLDYTDRHERAIAHVNRINSGSESAITQAMDDASPSAPRTLPS